MKPLLFLIMILGSQHLVAADTKTPGLDVKGNPQVFPASFFDKFAPRTAREMLGQIPGFLIRELDDVRGLGQATSNVLINGARGSGKEDSALATLGRVPARAVKKILILDGATSGIPGLSGDVADVIIDDEVTRGTWSWRTHHRSRLDPVWFRFDASLSGKKNSLSWAANLRNKPDRYGHWGLERVIDDTGSLIEERDEFASYNIERPGGSISLNWSPDSGQIANLSLSYKQVREDEDENSRRTSLIGEPETTRYLDIDEARWVSELSTDYEFDLALGRLKLIAYQRIEHAPLSEQTVVRSEDDVELRRRQFSRDSDIGESIVRGEYRWRGEDASRWQLAMEAAYNFIDADSTLSSSDNGGTLIAVPLNNGSAKVEERRFEVMATYGRSWNDFNMQLSLGGEFSKLEQSGAVGLSRDFTRPKGFISLSKPVSDRTLLSVKLAREVGQLDFFDFISSVNVDVQNAANGNPELVPPQTWLLEFRLEQELGDSGNLSLRFSYEDIDDIVDFIPQLSGGEAVGNLDTAKRYSGQWLSTTYLDSIGLPGAQLTLDYSLQRSVLQDPLTGVDRRIDGDTISYIFTELRQDVRNTNWAWGVNYNLLVKADTLRLNEIYHQSNTRGEMRAFVEHKNVLGLKASLLVRNLLDDRDQFERTIFDGSRLGQVSLIEDRFRPYGRIFEFQLEGAF